jgi:3-hydroxyisobutyryl-CoA hydrolase
LVVPLSRSLQVGVNLLTSSELGLATHYVSAESISDIIRQISEHSSPSNRNISVLIASYAPPPSSEVNSKKNPDGTTIITGEIRKFLDETFSKSSLTEVYKALEKGENHKSQEVREWAKEQKDVLDAKSPSGMAVALAAFKKAREAQRLDQTLLNDMAVATAFAVCPLTSGYNY